VFLERDHIRDRLWRIGRGDGKCFRSIATRVRVPD
jgi:hypothetical protein